VERLALGFEADDVAGGEWEHRRARELLVELKGASGAVERPRVRVILLR
jgi:hypothetical protein